ncbi:MAG TPA: hypothetical protein VE992_01890 [Solirubrobacteraceae bacterium]|nr:hypothetical protein [Solirubrobacteraceae bacterium]
MARAAVAVKAILVLGIGLHFRHRFHGPAVDYFGLALAAFASWSAVPGPGEPVLIAESIFAAKHSLDISSVIGVAWVGAAAGGMAGWLVGLIAGRRLVTARGPLRQARLRALERGEGIFKRHPVLAIYLTPSWVSGIHGVGTRIYVSVNTATSGLWAAVIGLGAYYAGPPIVEFADDLGTASLVALGVLIVASLGGELVRRRRRRGRASGQA